MYNSKGFPVLWIFSPVILPSNSIFSETLSQSARVGFDNMINMLRVFSFV